MHVRIPFAVDSIRKVPPSDMHFGASLDKRMKSVVNPDVQDILYEAEPEMITGMPGEMEWTNVLSLIPPTRPPSTEGKQHCDMRAQARNSGRSTRASADSTTPSVRSEFSTEQ